MGEGGVVIASAMGQPYADSATTLAYLAVAVAVVVAARLKR
jgi:hypothetical protein